jgi:hypothetical protein
MGLLGPLLQGHVGDTIVVKLRNNARLVARRLVVGRTWCAGCGMAHTRLSLLHAHPCPHPEPAPSGTGTGVLGHAASGLRGEGGGEVSTPRTNKRNHGSALPTRYLVKVPNHATTTARTHSTFGTPKSSPETPHPGSGLPGWHARRGVTPQGKRRGGGPAGRTAALESPWHPVLPAQVPGHAAPPRRAVRQDRRGRPLQRRHVGQGPRRRPRPARDRVGLRVARGFGFQGFVTGFQGCCFRELGLRFT